MRPAVYKYDTMLPQPKTTGHLHLFGWGPPDRLIGLACACLPSVQSQDQKFLLDFGCDSGEKGIYLAMFESEDVNTILVYLAKAWDSQELYGLSTQGSKIVLTS
jgi:hypothetical protein